MTALMAVIPFFNNLIDVIDDLNLALYGNASQHPMVIRHYLISSIFFTLTKVPACSL